MKYRKAIVFGGSGFLGSHVADTLTKNGYQVTIYDKRKSKYISKNQKMIIGEILDFEKINHAIKDNEIVFNFAGIADIDDCHNNPTDTVKYNILGNTNILEASVKNSVKKFLFSSSAYVYSSAGSFYKISKQASESITESFFDLHGIKYTILRYGSLYGERASSKNSIYKIIDEAVKQKKINYYGDGTENREFIHVKDAAELSLQAIEEKYDNKILMLTGSKSIQYIDLLNMIKEILNDEVRINMHPNRSKTHYKMSPYSFNPSVARKLVLNPHIDLGQGLLSLIDNIHNQNKL